MSKIQCHNPMCFIGGINRSKPKLGWTTLRECIESGLIISSRRLSQGFEPIGGIYLCGHGNWHHCTKPKGSSIICELKGTGFMLCSSRECSEEQTRQKCLSELRG